MARSARRPERRQPQKRAMLAAGAAAVLAPLARRPGLVGGSTAFLVAVAFVSANAIWYQPHAHTGAFFATRNFTSSLPAPAREPDGAAVLLHEPPAARPELAAFTGNRQIAEVQEVLGSLGFYSGKVDGMAGPATRQAIQDYQNKMGMVPTGVVDDALLEQLGMPQTTAAILPSPAPRDAAAPARPDEDVRLVQRGLRAFGNEAVDVDGLLGGRTRAAIREFQSMFGLAETGAADRAVIAKMQEIGLID